MYTCCVLVVCFAAGVFPCINRKLWLVHKAARGRLLSLYTIVFNQRLCIVDDHWRAVFVWLHIMVGYACCRCFIYPTQNLFFHGQPNATRNNKNGSLYKYWDNKDTSKPSAAGTTLEVYYCLAWSDRPEAWSDRPEDVLAGTNPPIATAVARTPSNADNDITAAEFRR